MNILIVDDQPLMLKSLQITFDKLSYNAICGKDGKEAKELYLEHKPSIVILDQMLPYFSGLELIKFIRANEEEYTWIMMLSSNCDQNTIKEAFDLGIDDYMLKPYMPLELVARVERLKRYKKTFSTITK